MITVREAYVFEDSTGCWNTVLDPTADVLLRWRTEGAIVSEVHLRPEWRPDRCPVTGHPFVTWVEGVPVYGDQIYAHALAERDEDGDLVLNWYDFADGSWSMRLADREVIPSGLNRRRLELKEQHQRRERDLLRANDIYLDRARRAEAELRTMVDSCNRQLAEAQEQIDDLRAALDAAQAARDA